MKEMNKIVYILMGCAVLAMIGFLVFKEVNEDEVAPQIVIDESVKVNYTPGCDSSVLLAGVSAVDDVDGEIKEDLVVENVYDFENGRVKVIYAAKDAAGNITKKERIVEYDISTTQQQVITPESVNEEVSVQEQQMEVVVP